MALTLTTPNTLLGLYQPKSDAARLWTNVATVILGTVVLTLSAKISVPVQPVPVTLQTLAVALLAAGFGARIALATVALYLVEGLAGLPVFASGGGFDYIFRPSFGFLVGYLPMAWIIGIVADRFGTRNFFTLIGAMIVADAVCFAFGFSWLIVVANMIVSSGAALPSWLNANDIVATGYAGAVGPFIGWDVVKMAFAALTITGVSLALFGRGAR
jgi:biotin transport system substrate-specific component